VNNSTVAAGALPERRSGRATAELGIKPSAQQQRIPGAFQVLLGLYIVLTGDFPTILQALSLGLPQGGGPEFALAMLTSLARDALLLVPVLVLARHPLGILHPLILAVVLWPLLNAVPRVIEEYGGWSGVLVGMPLETPFFVGLRSNDAATVWIAIAKYNLVQILSLICTYFGFWFFRGSRSFSRILPVQRNTRALRTILLGLVATSMLILAAYLYFRGGLGAHLTALGRGRFRELAGDGPIMVATDLGAVAMFVWVAARPGDVKSPAFLASLGIVVFAQFVSNGSRGSALAVLLVVGLVWSIRRQRVPWKIALLLLPFMFVSLGLLGAIRTSGWYGSHAGEAFATTGWTESVEIAQQEIQERRAMSAHVPVIERGFEVTDGPLYGQTYISALAAWIPRTLWENKPRGTGSVYAQRFLGESSEGAGIPVGPQAEMYWNFGLPGVILISIIYGVLIRGVHHFCWRRYPDPFAIVFLVIFLANFNMGTKGLIAFEQQTVLLFVCYVIISIFVPSRKGAVSPVFRTPTGPTSGALSLSRQ